MLISISILEPGYMDRSKVQYYLPVQQKGNQLFAQMQKMSKMLFHYLAATRVDEASSCWYLCVQVK